jgi:hypothetical protein
MIKVEKLNKYKIGDLVYEDSPSFSGIVSGECKGSLWIDDVENPSLALVYSFAVGSYAIMGNPQKESIYDQFYSFLINDFFHKLKEKNINDFEFSVETIETQNHILAMFSDKKIYREDEFSYQKKERTVEQIQIPLEYTIAKVNSDFVDQLEHEEYENKKFIKERLLESWGTYNNFLNKSTAFVALKQKRIVAVIVGTARFRNIIPIDIETEEQHRNKGLAFALTQFFVNECTKNQMIAHWNCVDSNIASKQTAQKAGFVLIKKKPYYWFEI